MNENLKANENQNTLTHTYIGPSGSASPLDSMSSTSPSSSFVAGNLSQANSLANTAQIDDDDDDEEPYDEREDERDHSPSPPVHMRDIEDRVDSHQMVNHHQPKPKEDQNQKTSPSKAFSSNLSKFQQQVDMTQQEQQQSKYLRNRSLSPPPPPPSTKPNQPHGHGPVIRNYINVQNAPLENNNVLEMGNGRNDARLGSPEKISYNNKAGSPIKEKYSSPTSSKPFNKQGSPVKESNNHAPGVGKVQAGNHASGNATNGVGTNVLTSVIQEVLFYIS